MLYSFHFTLLDEKHVYCENGQALSIFGEFCNECPMHRYSVFALTSNCSKSSNHFCQIDYYSSKICMDKVNVSIGDYCSGDKTDVFDCTEYYKDCPKANKGLNFEQCYCP